MSAALGSCMVVAVVASLAAAACGGPKPPRPRHLQVRIEALRFVPDTLYVETGDTVTWYNADLVPHTVSGDGWDSGSLAANASFTRVVVDASMGDYRCRYHPEMQAALRRR